MPKNEGKPNTSSGTPLFSGKTGLIDFTHQENLFVDFDRDKLIFHMLSTEGPGLSAGDANGDGLDDVYIGGAKDQSGALFLQSPNGAFKRSNEQLFDADRGSEDTRSVFFDADGDGDKDLYVCSGGNEFSTSSSSLIDRLYMNNGKGQFKKTDQILPAGKFESTSTVKAADFDGDGDQDLFVGIRVENFSYGYPMNGYLLKNNGIGQFTNVSDEIAPTLKAIGLITDAVWSDLDGDRDQDLVIVGEYMPITVLMNEKGRFMDATISLGLDKTNGWWNTVVAADIDGDGDEDLVAGNHGLNSRLKADSLHPVSLYVHDFDQNGTLEHILCAYNGNTAYPLALRHDLIAQVPEVKKKFQKYEDYKNATLEDIFPPERREGALVLKSNWMATSVVINNGKNRWTVKPLPGPAQYSPVHALLTDDFNGDGKTDILMGGNLYRVKPEIGRYDASFGLLLTGDGKGGFIPMHSSQSGIRIDGEIRSFTLLRTARRNEKLLVVGRNNLPVLTYRLQPKP